MNSTGSTLLLKDEISVCHQFSSGDLGHLIYIHGTQNVSDYGFNEVHEAYCAKIAAEFILNADPKRSKVWLLKKRNSIVGSVFIIERSLIEAQLRLLFVDKSIRGAGLGRWLVQEAVEYCRSVRFERLCLWTVKGLDRAISIYESLGFVKTESQTTSAWGVESVENRYDLFF